MPLQPFTRLTSVAAPLLMDNIDTDRILPAAYMKGLTRNGLGVRLFDKMRYVNDGSANPDFILNQPPFDAAQILLSGVNFGCGSSREHAVWALKDFGIRVIIAAGYGTIFANNCARNGILLITLPDAQLAQIAALGAQPLTVDLESNSITLPDGARIAFTIDAQIRARLLSGEDDIARTLRHVAAIDAFEASAGR